MKQAWRWGTQQYGNGRDIANY